MTAGTSVIRTTKASTAMPTARPSAMGLRLESPSGTKATNTENMISAAAATTLAEPVKPSRTARRASPPCTHSSRIRETRKTS